MGGCADYAILFGLCVDELDGPQSMAVARVGVLLEGRRQRIDLCTLPIDVVQTVCLRHPSRVSIYPHVYGGTVSGPAHDIKLHTRSAFD